MTFFEALFDEGEKTCFATRVTDKKVRDARSGVLRGEQYFSINPLGSSRADSEVTAFRNFLIEYDNLDRQEQLDKLRHVPWTTLVWSGGKSYHAIISLAEPVSSKEEYIAIFSRINKKLKGIDKANKNPSRLSRIGAAFRDNGELQEVLGVKARVSREELESWLPLPEPARPKVSIEVPRGFVPLFARTYLRVGAPEGRRNSDLFLASCQLFRSGWSTDQVYDAVQGVADLKDHEIRSCVNSARKAVDNES